MNRIELELSIEEINLILTSLGRMPFAQVFQLINNIKGQVDQQLAPAPAAEAPQSNGQSLSPQPEVTPPPG